MRATPGGIREVVVWWIRTSEGWSRLGHLGLRVLAVVVLVLALILPWGPVSEADETEPPAGPTAQEAAEARAAVRAGELDVAQAQEALAALREELADAQIRVQSAAADYQEAEAALAAAEQEVRDARRAAKKARASEAEARTALAGVYRATRHGHAAPDRLGPLELVFDAESVDDLIGRDAAERAVRRKLAAALTRYADTRAVSDSADERWTAARAARAEAKDEAAAAYEAARVAMEDLAERARLAQQERAALIERLAVLRDTSVRIEKEREEARAAAAQAEQEARAREELGMTGPAGGAEEGSGDQAGDAGTGGAGGDSGSETGPNPGGVEPDTDVPDTDVPDEGPPDIDEPDPEPELDPAPPPEAPDTTPTAQAQGRIAVDWARTKIGSPYELGAEGPTAYDCSGLTSEAWRQAGKWITRTSRSQYLAVSHIGYDDLRPGDLIFYGTDRSEPQSIYHVAMYTGPGRMIEAVMPGVPLRETDLRLSNAMPYAGRP